MTADSLCGWQSEAETQCGAEFQVSKGDLPSSVISSIYNLAGRM